MAYGLKYELLCRSRLGNNYKLKLLFDGYVGDDIDRNMPKEGALILRKDKAAVVRGTSLEFGIREEVDFELDEFYTNNSKKIKAELYKDSTLLWTGYVLPQQYQAPYIPAPQSIKFTATDGLGLLKNEEFTLTGNSSQLAIIIHCLDKIALGLGYSIAINLFETTHNHSYSPLAQTYEDAGIYEDNNCYDVIEKILQKYDAEITQFNGRWHITCSADKKSTRMLYTSAGVYETTEAAQAVLDLGYKGTGIEVWPVGSLTRTLEPGAKKVILSHNYGRKESLLDNYEFWRFAGGAFASWTKSGTFALYQRILEGEAYAFLSGGDSGGTDQIFQQIDVTAPAGELFVFEMMFAPIGKNNDGHVNAINMTVRFAVSVLVGSTPYYLQENGTWTTSATIISKTVLASISAPVWNVISIIAEGIPGAGTLTVALYRYGEEETPHRGDVFSGIAFSKPKIYFLKDGELYLSGIKTLATFNDSTEPDDLGTIDLSAADGPAVDNVTLLYKNITKLSSGDPTTLWHRLGSAAEYIFMVQLARTLASRGRSARQVLKGTVRGTGISFGSFVKHTYNSSREFEIAEGSWDMYEEKWDVTLLELLAWSDEDITFSDTEENGASASTNNNGYVGTVISNSAIPVGAQGPQGYQGNQGNQGYRGYTGDQGPQGDQGYPGTPGSQGTPGSPGPQGWQGDQGYRGYQGYQGPQGDQGYPGVPGSQGNTGATGPQGEQGDQGYQGYRGYQGNQGNQGDQGYPGVTGPQGAAGSPGPQGWQGDQGYRGFQGSTGPQGDQGYPGPTGSQGNTGATGPQGNQGDQGAQGYRGYQGYQGAQGAQGAYGGYTGTVTYTFTSMTFENGLLQSTT